MRGLCRILVMWLLVLALPVQAIAGAWQMQCQGHAGPRPDAVAVHGHLDESAAAAPMASHCDEQAAEPTHRCSACAACTLGTALAPATVKLPDPVPAAAPEFVPAGAVPSFIGSGLERPPRTGSA